MDAGNIAQRSSQNFNIKPILLTIAVMALVSGLLQVTAPYSQGIGLIWQSLFHFDSANYQHIITHYTYLPRLAVALICGFALAVAGCVMQFVLRNPIASPTTLGVAAGAEFGMVLGLLLLPATSLLPNFVPAFIGGCLATGLVFLLSSSRGFSPLHMVLAGLVVSLFLGSVNTMLLLLHEQRLTTVFVWGAGVLNQNDWSSTQVLLPLVTLPTILLLILQRPLSVLQFGDNVATSLGVNIKQIKLLCLSLAIFITAAVVSEVGLIGFVGIVAPAIARMLGARTLAKQIEDCSGGIITKPVSWDSFDDQFQESRLKNKEFKDLKSFGIPLQRAGEIGLNDGGLRFGFLRPKSRPPFIMAYFPQTVQDRLTIYLKI